MSKRFFSKKNWYALACMLVLSALFSLQARAQVAGGTLSGSVMDASGATIPAAQISIKNVATGVTRSVTTDGAGFYIAPNLLPGNYDLEVSASGFSTLQSKGITLTVGAQQVLNLTMQVGQMTQVVSVSTAAPTVELASASLSAVLNSTTVRELPINGRSWTDLATLQPGVATIETQSSFNTGAARGNRGFGSQVTISGARPQQNNYRLDGISINDYANGAPGSVLGGNLGVDSIQEFSVITTNASADYGKTSGGVVNAATRAGTDEFHGNAYEFLRNSALDARNFFDGSKIPPFRRNQFGGSIGGPIHKDRTFFFADYEGIRESLGLTSVVTVPSVKARAGMLCSNPGTPPTCSPQTVVVDPVVQRYLGLFGLPNGRILGNGDTGKFNFVEQQSVSENFVTGRLDHKFSEKDSVFGSYTFDKTPFSTPDNFNDVLTRSLTKRQLFIVEENHVFSPALVNSVRFGFNRNFTDNAAGTSAINPLAADTSLGGVPGHNASELSVQGLSTFTGGLGGSAFFYRWNSFQGYDDAFLVHGLHSLKFGFAVEREQLNQLYDSEPLGKFSFASLSDFLTNKPSRFVAAFPNLLTGRGIRQIVFGLYVQDDWRWRPNVTLNFGLRYEMATVPTEVNGKLSNLYNLSDNNGTVPTPHLGSPLFSNPTLRNFEPRLGFAWDPFGKGTTAIHAGFGMFDSLPLPYEFTGLASRAAPFFEIGSVSAPTLTPGSFPGGAFSQLGPQNFEYSSIEQNPHRNYVMQWNLNVQQEIIPNLTALIGYVGSRGVHQPFRADDANIVLPTLTSAGYLWPFPVGSQPNVNPVAGDIRYLNWGGDSFYDSLEVGITKKMTHGLQVQGSFTWSKSIDDNSGVVAGDTFGNSIPSLHWFDLRLDRAVSDFNVGRTLVLSGTWLVPGRKSLSGPASLLVNGWELGAIFKANDGVPFTTTFGTDGDPQGLNSSDPWAFPNRLTTANCATLTNSRNPDHYIKTECFAVPTAPPSFFAGSTPVCSSDPRFVSAAVGDPTLFQCFNLRGNAGRNILRGPGLSNLDFSIYKNVPVKRISEAFNVQFRTEIFNILNRANFAIPIIPDNTDIFDSTGARNNAAGLLTSTTTTARQIQFALKMVW
jgi:Carboxypeptidase regulatory-like domain/TonB-dependent Receptor Plug Domain/TonB dependent receptor